MIRVLPQAPVSGISWRWRGAGIALPFIAAVRAASHTAARKIRRYLGWRLVELELEGRRSLAQRCVAYLLTAIDFRKSFKLYAKKPRPTTLTIRNCCQTALRPPPR